MVSTGRPCPAGGDGEFDLDLTLPFPRSPGVDLLGVERRLDILVLKTLRLLNGPYDSTNSFFT
eukprot:3139715-Prorocentrum_lima.AAC.1